MSRTVRVNVTQEDIDHGLPNSAIACPISLALRRVPEIAQFDCFVWGSGITLGDNDVALPASAREFIERYDEKGRRRAKPFSFNLEVPE